MIAAFLLNVILATPPAPAASTPAPPAGWTSQPSGKPGDLFSYVRIETDGTKSAIMGTRQVCDCEPSNMTALLAQALSVIPSAAIIRDTAPACGFAAQHVLATGIANRDRSNLEIYAFRKDGALYMFEYTFQEKAPDPQAETTLLSHCPGQGTRN